MVVNSACCIICQNLARVEEVLVLQGQMICTTCEQTMLSYTPHHPDYEFYIRGLKKIWRLLLA